MDDAIGPEFGLELASDFSVPVSRASPSTGRVSAGVKREIEEGILEAINEVVAEEGDFSSVEAQDATRETSSGLAVLQTDRLKTITVQLPASTLIFPRSVCANYAPPAEVVKERQAVQSLLGADPAQEDEDFIEFELDKFSCYVDTPQYDSEMRALHSHATLSGKETFYFDGVLRAGNVKCYVKRVPFEEIPLGNYGQEEPSVGDQMWICSLHNSRRNIYYKLKNPSLEYTRYHENFIWVADLAKHVVDFCTHLLKQDRGVTIHLFKEDFSAWLKATHQTNTSFQKWHARRGSDDFRQPIVANSPYIRKEVCSLFSPKELRRISVFGEISNPLSAIPAQGEIILKGEPPQTIVTPYIYECFSHLEAGKMLKAVQPSVGTEETIRRSWPQAKLPFIQKGMGGAAEALACRIRPGDIISTPPDDGTIWKTKVMDKKWYGLIQKVHITKTGRRRFDVIWIYQPEDTPCCSMKYPWENELFLSNHCTCGESQKVSEDQILGVHSVEWHGSPGTKAEFFLRQTYLSDERRFITLKEAHRHCSHGQTELRDYSSGDTVLVKLPQSDYLEPCELVEYLDDVGEDVQVRLRRLKRLSEFARNFSPNELVYTDDEVCCAVSAIATKCIVRCYPPNERVPVPYNQHGVGNAFFLTHTLLKGGQLQPWTPGAEQPSFRQGFDPTRNVKKLRALDLFSGFGNFGRGVEDGGAVESRWANDIWDVAAHTYKLNSRDPQSMHPFLGSIDDLLRQGIEGKFSRSVPRPDEVDVILGGSPCQGFSLITLDKNSSKQLKNRSMIASFASAVDFWRPQWGILENVRTIVKSRKDVTEDYFSQLICALVGMGYQTQIVLGDAWLYGTPQLRTRVFLCFAAPGLRLPQPPYPSHSGPTQFSSGRLGEMTNGEPYVYRENRLAAFKYITAAEATADLPEINDGKTDTCVEFPDHRLSIGITTGGGLYGGRKQIRSIPAGPYGVNFSKAYYGRRGGVPDMFPGEAQCFPLNTRRTKENSNAWGRQHPHRLFRTVTTACQYSDAYIGGSLMHWNQPRPLSVMEVRRAQGVPDNEVLCGSPRDQWKLVGNAVARQVSIAMGLMLREAWAGTLYEVEGSVGEGPVGNAMPVSLVSDASDDFVVQEANHKPPRMVYVIDNDDDDDDDDENMGDICPPGLPSQADGGTHTSARSTSLNRVQNEPRDTTPPLVAAAAPPTVAVPNMDSKKRPLSQTTFVARNSPLSLSSSSPPPSPSSPFKKPRVVIEISDDEEEASKMKEGGGAVNKGVTTRAPTTNGGSATVVRLSPGEVD